MDLIGTQNNSKLYKSITLTFTGDFFPGNLPYRFENGIAEQFNRNKGRPWLIKIKKIFNGSDLVITNLESPLLNPKNYPEKKLFAGSTQFACFLKDLGIEIVSIANNHILEYGFNGFNSTIAALDQYEIKSIGKYEEGSANYITYKKHDTTISIASFNNIRDFDNSTYIADFSENIILNMISKMHASDFIILIFHWGDEYVQIPSYEQIKLAQKFIDAGSNIIIGHHPHVIQPIMHYNNGIIFFSLGNFFFDMNYSKNTRIGIVPKITLKKGEHPTYTVEGIYTEADGSPKLIEKGKIAKYMKRYNQLFYKYLSLPESEYKRKYNIMHRKNRTIQRIFMKKPFIKNFYRIPFKEYKRIVYKSISLQQKNKYI